MRLLQRRLPTRRQTQKPRQQFLAHLWGLLLRLPGHATFRHLRRYRASHERTCARWYAGDVDVVTFNKAALLRVLPPAHPPALVSAASFVPTRGQKTSGLERCWNGRHRRPETGLEISDVAGLDSTDTGADGLRVAPTPSTGEAPEREPPRLDVYLDQVTRVVAEPPLRPLRSVITDGYDSTQDVLGGVRALGLAPMGPLRLAAKLRALDPGPHR